MRDSETGERIEVTDGGDGGPAVLVRPADQGRVERLLGDHGIPVTGRDVMRGDGRARVVILELGPDADGDQVQAALDSVGLSSGLTGSALMLAPGATASSTWAV